MSSRRSQDMSSRRLQHNNFSSSKTSWRRLQRNNFSSSKTSWRRLARGLENVFKESSRRLRKMSSRRLGRRKIVTSKTCWRHLQDMFWRPTNVCWDTLLKGYCFYFRAALAVIHCVLTMHLPDYFIRLAIYAVKVTMYLFYNTYCIHLSNQVNCDCFNRTEEVLHFFKERNCSPSFSMVPIFSLCIPLYSAINSLMVNTLVWKV